MLVATASYVKDSLASQRLTEFTADHGMSVQRDSYRTIRMALMKLHSVISVTMVPPF